MDVDQTRECGQCGEAVALITTLNVPQPIRDIILAYCYPQHAGAWVVIHASPSIPKPIKTILVDYCYPKVLCTAFVKTIYGRTITMNYCQDNTTVEEAIAGIMKHFPEIKSSQSIVLIASGRPMLPENLVDDYDVQRIACIHAIVRTVDEIADMYDRARR